MDYEKNMLLVDRRTREVYQLGSKLTVGTDPDWEIYPVLGKGKIGSRNWLDKNTRPYWAQNGIELRDRAINQPFVKLYWMRTVGFLKDGTTGLSTHNVIHCQDRLAQVRYVPDYDL